MSVGAGYFQVTVNAVSLDYEASGGRTFDPMVMAVTECLHGGKLISVPFTISPRMLAGVANGLPQRMVYGDTRVAGPFPYYGRVSVAVILYRVTRDDYVRRVLEALHKTCGALDPTGGVAAYLKVADAVLDGVDVLLERTPTEPLLGFRADLSDPLEFGTFALLPSAIPSEQLWLEGETLSVGAGGQLSPIARTNSVTYTVEPASPPDLQQMPWFSLLWNRIVQWANIPNDEAKNRAKTYLGALYEELMASPDIARDTVDTLYAVWEDKARSIHANARSLADWGPEKLRSDPLRARVLELQEAW
jgi:hypothetical protein